MDSSLNCKKFSCKHCSKLFGRNSNLRQHVKLFHSNQSIPDRLKRNACDEETALFNCVCCEMRFRKRFLLTRHLRKVHPGQCLPSLSRLSKKSGVASNVSAISTRPTTAAGKTFSCSHCTKSFMHRRSLARHMKTSHPDHPNLPDNRSLQLDVSNKTHLQFNSLADFEQWKYQEELKTLTWHVKCGMKSPNLKSGRLGCRRIMYRCHRSGIYKPKGSGVRFIKSQGTCKIGTLCPASIHIKVLPDGKVTGWYNNNHAVHIREVGHLCLHKRDRAKIAGLIAAGIPMDDILTQVWNWGGNTVSPFHLVRKKDLHNIASEFHVAKRHQLHKNDTDSVAIWVESHRDVCHYVKWQTEASSDGILRVEDFMLIIMNDLQVAMLKKYGGPGKQVGMDSTHGTGGHKFQLTTIMVIDDHGEGFPAAFCYSNHVDEIPMVKFLSVVKETLGHPLEQVILMTDDAEAFSNAWNKVMGLPAHRLLCVWHVDRAWRKNLPKITDDGITKYQVYRTLRALMEMTDAEAFQEKLQSFVDYVTSDAKTKMFGKYFVDWYAHRPKLWAYCYRNGLHVHHNMHLEAFHRVIKHARLQGRKVRRLDLGISTLMRVLLEKSSDRLLKLYKGKWTRHGYGIRERHKRGLNELQKKKKKVVIRCIEENVSYAVCTTSEDFHIVEQLDSPPHPPSTCPLNCSVCQICLHSFVCTCLDSGLRNTICKHVHMVVTHCSPVLNPPSANADDENEIPAAESSSRAEETELILAERRISPLSLDERKARLSAQWSNILSAIGPDTPSLLDEAEAHMSQLTAYMSIMHRMPAEPFPESGTRPPANAKIAPQRQFIVTRASNKRVNKLSLRKPTTAEKAIALDALDGTSPVVLQRRVDTDHDYDQRPSDLVLAEHCYQ